MQGGRVARRARPRAELRIPLAGGTDLVFGFALRAARRPDRARGPVGRRATLRTAALCVFAAVAPVAIVVAAPELGRIGATAAQARIAPAAAQVAAEPIIRAPRSLVTAVREDPPALRAHVVARGETLLSIAARYGITPQTLAYDNGLAATGDLRVGRALVVPPLDAAIQIVAEGETLAQIAARFGVDADTVRAVNRVAYEPADVTAGRALLIPVAEGRYPGFRLRVTDAPRVFAPHVRWPTVGVVTQLFSPWHTGIDIAAPYGAPIVAGDSGTVSAVGWRGSGGLVVCVLHDWGLETCAYHASSVSVEAGERVSAGQRIASVGSSGVSTGPHVHWEARTNGVLVDPMSYAPETAVIPRVGGATGSP
jgi:murein DD-endopeptidase MepM/ murein hydrolase activator NlpD